MATQTEKLEKNITRIIKREFMLITPQDMSKLILKACKEFGLVFAKIGVEGDDLEGASLCKIEEIEI